MEQSPILKCESKHNQTHSGTYYYCQKCKEVVCNECLIAHLCSSAHERISVQKIEDAVTNGKMIYSSLQELLNTEQSSVLPDPDEHSIEKYLLQKESEAHKLHEAMLLNTSSIKETIEAFFSLLINKNQKAQECPADKVIQNLNEELSVIASDWNTLSAVDQVDYLKKIPQYEMKIKDIRSLKDKKTQMNQSKAFKDRTLKKVNAMIDDIALNKFVNWYEKQLSILNQRISNQITQLEKSLDEDYSSDEHIIKPIAVKSKHLIENERRDSNPSKLFTVDVPNQVKGLLNKDYRRTFRLSQEQCDEIKANVNDISSKNIYPYVGTCLFCVRRKESSSPIELYVYLNKKVQVQHLNPSHFIQCFTPYFPLKNNKAINLGNSLMITGGCIETTITNKVFIVKHDEIDQIKVVSFKPMIFNREGHNILYVKKSDSVIICSGQMNITAEMVSLSSVGNDWEELPQMNDLRSNGSMVLMNESIVFCIGGYNNQTNTYAQGYERLDLDDIAEGWKCIVTKENIAISTMGVVALKDNSALLLGGFEGGKKYLQDGIFIEEDKDSGKVTIERKENALNKGLIFYSSPIFYQIEDEIVNFDFKQNIVRFDPLTQKAKIVSS